MTTKDWLIVAFILTLAIGAGLVSAYQYYDGVKKDIKNDSLNFQLKESQLLIINEQKKNNDKANALAEANQKNFELSQQLNNKANKIIESNLKVIDAQQTTIKSIVGDGYPRILVNHHDMDIFRFILRKESDFPINNISVVIQNIDQLLSAPSNIVEGKKIIQKIDADKSYILFDKNFSLAPGPFSIELPANIKINYGYNHFTIRVNSYSGITNHLLIIYIGGSAIAWAERIYDNNRNILKTNLQNMADPGDVYWTEHFLFKDVIIATKTDNLGPH